jgi:hypothetical protein
LIELEARCAQLSANNEALKQEHSREVARLRQLMQKSTLENNRLEGVKRENALLSARLIHLEQAHAESALEAQLADLKSANEVLHLAAQRTWSLEKSLRDAHGELDRMARERDALVAERNAMQHLFATSVTKHDPSAECAGNCQDCESASPERCVLFIGGRNALLPHYHTLAHRLGIRLMHHEGSPGSIVGLPELIRRVDAVVCPTDNTDFGTYQHLKQYCERSGKPYLLYRGGGLAGFAAALAHLSGGEALLAAGPLNDYATSQ